MPGPPIDVAGISTSSDGERVRVGWSPPLDDGGSFITAYRVQASRDGITWPESKDSECEPPAPGEQCFPELTVVFSYALRPYDTFVFRVAAYNDQGWGPWSANSPPFTVLPGNRPRPLPPRDVVAAPILDGIQMRWRPPVDSVVTSYFLQWSRDGVVWPNGDYASGTSFTISDLPRGTYSVRVRVQRYEVEYSEWVTVAGIVVPDRRQRIKDADALPPHLEFPGTTRLAPCGLTTNVGQPVRTSVRWELLGRTTRGSVDPVLVRERGCGKVSITLSGVPVKVWVTQAAHATGRYAKYFSTRVYRLGR